MKKFMIRCDVEGVTGVVSPAQAEPGMSESAFGLTMFMSDLLAVVEGLASGGADEVWIYDEHFHGRNIDLARMPKYVRAICGKPPYRADWAGGLDASFAGLVLLGFHSKAGTPDGVLEHTYEPDLADLVLGGKSVGEIGMETAIAGDWNVPLVLFCGDSAGLAEAKALVPNVAGVAVKESLGQREALCYPATLTAERIRAAAEQVAKAPPPCAPWKLAPEVALEAHLRETPYTQAVRRLHQNRMTHKNVLRMKGPSTTAVWADYWRLKLECLAAAAGK